MCSAVTGATSLEQLQQLITAVSKVGGDGTMTTKRLLNDELREAIDRIHAKYPNPTP